MFDYEIVDAKKVLLYWEDEHVKTLKSKEALRFIDRIDHISDAERQDFLAKLIGNVAERGKKKRQYAHAEEYDY